MYSDRFHINQFFKLLISFFIFTSCQKDYESIELEFVDQSFGQNATTQYKKFFILEDRIRGDIEVVFQGEDTPKNLRSNKGLSLSIFFERESKKFFIAAHQLKKIIANPNFSSIVGSQPAIAKAGARAKKTGANKNIQNFSCEVLAIEQEMPPSNASNNAKTLLYEGCVASYEELGIDPKFGQNFSELTRLMVAGMGIQFEDQHGIILESRVYDKSGQKIMESKFQNIKKSKVQDNLFDAPIGYETLN
jgi:hypothetical protein